MWPIKNVNFNQGVNMKKSQMKNKLKIFSLVALFCAVLFSGIFSIQTKQNLNSAQIATTFATDQTETIVSELVFDSTILADKFNLRDSYPLVAENQTTSNYCWIYSSAKALESALMVQRNEHLNISETAIAYLAYANKLNGETSVVNSDGTFKNFVHAITNYGIVHESDFSNDNFFDMNEENAENYSYVEAFADKSWASSISTIAFNENNDYSAMSLEEKQTIIKKFIVKYGGVFVGVQEGVVVGNGPYTYSNDQSTEGVKEPINQPHAVCLIGWDDSRGFLALNSWGTKIEEFYIPFNYAYSYTDEKSVFGFIVGEPKVDVVQTSATLFDSYTNYDADLENVFCVDEEVSLKYSIDSSYPFEQVYVEVFKGGNDVSHGFVVNYNDANSQISVKMKTDVNFEVGGDYLVRFYQGSKLIASKSFFVFTGTELSYFELSTISNGQTISDNSLLLAGYLSSTNSVTYYLSPTGNNYQLTFSLTDMNDWWRTDKELSFSVGTPYVHDVTASGEISEYADGVVLQKVNSATANTSNLYQVKVMGLHNYKGMLVTFDITINSNVNELSSHKQKYYFNIFVSNVLTTKTTNAYAIEYVLDGGKNSEKNVDRYPVYVNETKMTEVALFEPTKEGQTFLGWYKDKNFTTKITQIDRNFASDIVLYAKWQKAADVTLFTTEFETSKVLSYEGETKTVANNELVYGDTITLDYTFKPTNNFEKEEFDSMIVVCYLNDVAQTTTVLSGDQEVVSKVFGFPTQKVGKYTVRVETTLVKNHSDTMVDVKEIKFSVVQKLVNPVYSDTQVVYDGKAHKPTVTYAKGDVYAEDKAAFEIKFLNESRTNAGTYLFDNIQINNNNYKLAENSSCNLVIKQIGLKLVWDKTSAVYNGTAQMPSYKLEGLLEGDTTNIYISETEMINVGEYDIAVDRNSALNSNYYLEEADDCKFTITKAPIKVVISNVTDRTENDPENRKTLENCFTIEGDYYCTLAELAITLSSDGLTATKTGEYAITGTCGNANYEATFVDGVYTLTGYYYVYYKLPNGETYIETVEAGKNPKGIDDEIFKTSLFQKLIYSEPLEATGYDLHIDVTVKDYTGIAVIVAVVVAFVVVYLIITRKHRRNKVG